MLNLDATQNQSAGVNSQPFPGTGNTLFGNNPTFGGLNTQPTNNLLGGGLGSVTAPKQTVTMALIGYIGKAKNAVKNGVDQEIAKQEWRAFVESQEFTPLSGTTIDVLDAEGKVKVTKGDQKMTTVVKKEYSDVLYRTLLYDKFKENFMNHYTIDKSEDKVEYLVIRISNVETHKLSNASPLAQVSDGNGNYIIIIDKNSYVKLCSSFQTYATIEEKVTSGYITRGDVRLVKTKSSVNLTSSEDFKFLTIKFNNNTKLFNSPASFVSLPTFPSVKSVQEFKAVKKEQIVKSDRAYLAERYGDDPSVIGKRFVIKKADYDSDNEAYKAAKLANRPRFDEIAGPASEMGISEPCYASFISNTSVGTAVKKTKKYIETINESASLLNTIAQLAR